MPGQRRWGPITAALAFTAALGAFVACTDDVGLVDFSVGSPDNELGGQTGSLVPGCGLAPLSTDGASVPTGDAIAILYAKDCPNAVALNRVSLRGEAGDTRLTLVPLEGADVYLVRTEQRVVGGTYELDIGMAGNSITVGSAVAPPARVGTLVPESLDACEEPIRFQLRDPVTLAYAPIARFLVSIDGGDDQLWVNYGALPITATPEGSSAELVLPRCGSAACLSPGTHQLVLRMDIAGIDAQPAPSVLDFESPCPLPQLEAESTNDSDSGCALAARPTRTAGGGLVLASLLGALLGRRRSRRGPRR